MRIAKLAAVLGFLAATTMGCMYRTAVVSNDNNAFVTKTGLFGSSMWHCKAEGGKAVCTKVSESE